MYNFNYSEIGSRIRSLRKSKGMNQSELAEKLKKSLRTVQKYETGEIEISFSVACQIANILDSTPSFVLGLEQSNAEIKRFSDVVDFLFKLDSVTGLDFRIDVKKPPRSERWECSITFDGKSPAENNADMCLFLEDWEDEREERRQGKYTKRAYSVWQESTKAYYGSLNLECADFDDYKEDSNGEYVIMRTYDTDIDESDKNE